MNHSILIPVPASANEKVRKNTVEDNTRRTKRKVSNYDEAPQENAQLLNDLQFQPYEKEILQVEVDVLASKVTALEAEFRSILVLRKNPSKISKQVERQTLVNTILDGELDKNRAEVIRLMELIEDEKKKGKEKGKAKMFLTLPPLENLPPTSAPIFQPASAQMNYENKRNDGRYLGKVRVQAEMVNQSDGNLWINLYSSSLNQQQLHPVAPQKGMNQVNMNLPKQKRSYVIQPQPSVPVTEPMPLQQQLGFGFNTGLQAHGNLNDLVQNGDLDQIRNFIVNPNNQHWF